MSRKVLRNSIEEATEVAYGVSSRYVAKGLAERKFKEVALRAIPFLVAMSRKVLRNPFPREVASDKYR